MHMWMQVFMKTSLISKARDSSDSKLLDMGAENQTSAFCKSSVSS